jgi:hypothetical protein
MIWQALTLAASLSGVTSIDLNFKAWQSANNYPVPSDFPELQDETVTSRPNTAIAFTGGGSRSFLASIGYLAGLNELGQSIYFSPLASPPSHTGLIPNIRYMSGISGGSWATLTYTYSQLVCPHPCFLPSLLPVLLIVLLFSFALVGC